MKTYEEMVQSVLTRIEEYEIEKRSKRQKIRKAALVSVPVCVAVIAAAGTFQSGVVGNSNKVPVAETEKSIVSSVSEKEIKTVSSKDSKEENKSVSSKVNTKSELVSSEKKRSSSKNDSKEKTESAIVNSNPYYESSTDNVSVLEEDVSSSAADSTPNHESNHDTEPESSQTLSAVGDEEVYEDNYFEPEPGFEDVDDALGMIYKDGVMYLQFSVYDDGFTLDEYIGAASDFNGYYKNIKDVTGEVYTVKESPDVLIVKLSNGGTVALAKAGQLIVNGTQYCSTMLDTNVYLADRFLGYVSDFETVNVPYFDYEIELSPNDEVYTVVDKDEQTLCIKQENGNVVIFVSMW
ncbi:MAG: hypothetical protein IIY78_01805 [Clostridia bacterium]|nr:hypothetical protein [Clostridia bacterium]